MREADWALLSYLLYGVGSLCFLGGTAIAIWRILAS